MNLSSEQIPNEKKWIRKNPKNFEVIIGKNNAENWIQYIAMALAWGCEPYIFYNLSVCYRRK